MSGRVHPAAFAREERHPGEDRAFYAQVLMLRRTGFGLQCKECGKEPLLGFDRPILSANLGLGREALTLVRRHED